MLIFTHYMYINILHALLFMCAHWHTQNESDLCDLCKHSITPTRTEIHAYIILLTSRSSLAFLCTFDVTYHFAGPHTTDSGVWQECEAAHLQRLQHALLLPH